MQNPLGQRLRELPGPVLLTGHTGFKGTWMTFLFEQLKIPVVGYSLPPEKDSLYDRASRTSAIPEKFADIRDYAGLEEFIDFHKPSTIIHMAAQPLVLRSYESPRETFDVNTMGTVNVLDIAFKKDFLKAVIVVTTDKVYRNDNSGRAFIESDPLEGKDPYSASKVGTEAVVAAWQQISKVSGGPKVVSVRSGNVIGGGDFASFRILPDLVRGLINNSNVSIRNPESSRPWLHVIEPLTGYLQVLELILQGNDLNNVNFAPVGEGLKVRKVVEIFQSVLSELNYTFEPDKLNSRKQTSESVVLNLDASLAFKLIRWKPIFTQEESVKHSAYWWRDHIDRGASASEVTLGQIQDYLHLFREKSESAN